MPEQANEEPSENNLNEATDLADDYQLDQSRQLPGMDQNLQHATRNTQKMNSLPGSDTCGTTTGIKLVYDPETKQLFKQSSNGELVISDLQLASIHTQGDGNRLDTQQMQQ